MQNNMGITIDYKCYSCYTILLDLLEYDLIAEAWMKTTNCHSEAPNL